MNNPELSVIVCTHNPNAEVLRRVMAALEVQNAPTDRWELILIDNLSDQPIDCRRDLLGIPPHARVIAEQELGLTPARLRGIREARSEILVFVDDDNILKHDYLSRAMEILEKEPQLGAVGGVVSPDFEQRPASYLGSSLNLLGLRDYGEYPIRALIRNVVGPWEPIGAGLVIRRKIAEHYAGLVKRGVRRLLDRRGKMLSSCGDTDMVRCAVDLGLMMGYEPTLQLTHRIPAFRTRPLYLLRLHMWVALSGTVLDRIRGNSVSPLVGMVAVSKFWLRAIMSMITTHPFVVLVRFSDAVGRFRGRRLRLTEVSGG